MINESGTKTKNMFIIIVTHFTYTATCIKWLIPVIAEWLTIEASFLLFRPLSILTVVNVSRNGRGALYKPLKLLTLKTRKIHLNRPFKVLHSLHLLTDKPYMQYIATHKNTRER